MMDDIMTEEIEVAEENEPFAIKDDVTAEWALKKIIAARKERDRLVALHDAEIERLTKKRQEVIDKCDASTSGLQYLLEEYFQTVNPRRTKTTATYQLLSGRLVVKRGTVEYERKDDQICSWLANNGRGNLVQTKTVTTPKWGELKKITEVVGDAVVIKETGEVVEGVKAVRKPNTFNVIGTED